MKADLLLSSHLHNNTWQLIRSTLQKYLMFGILEPGEGMQEGSRSLQEAPQRPALLMGVPTCSTTFQQQHRVLIIAKQ